MKATEVRLLELTQAWALARRALSIERRALAAHRCEFKERGDPETGDGRDACYRLWSDINDEWCAPCRWRQPHFQALLSIRSVERNQFRRLCAFVNRTGEKPDQ